MIELENEIIRITKFQIIQRIHKHNLSNGKLFNPTFISLNSKQVPIWTRLLPTFHLFNNICIGIYITNKLLNDCLNILILF